jgi:type I restriction enzyme S subunit
MGELKPGWRRVKFGQVVRLNRETCKDPAQEGIDRVIGLEHLEPGDLRVRRWADLADGTTFTNRVRPGQVLFGKRRAYQRKVAVADFDAICSGDIYVFETADPKVLLPELLPYICQTDAFFEHAVGTSAGSLSPRTNWSSLAEHEFALPPLEEQRRMVGRLEVAHEVVARARELAENADRVRKAFLVATFRPGRGNRDQYPATWRVANVGEAGEVQLGQKRDPSVHLGANMRPYLRVANVFDDEFDLSDVLSMHFADRDLPTYTLRDGDILLNEGQSPDLLGRSAIWRADVPDMCFQMTLLRFRAGPELLPEFAHAFFQHMLYTKQFAAQALQTTSIAHLSASKFSRMSFPIPPKADQEAILQVYESLRAGRWTAQHRYAGARELARAFRAEGL